MRARKGGGGAWVLGAVVLAAASWAPAARAQYPQQPQPLPPGPAQPYAPEPAPAPPPAYAPAPPPAYAPAPPPALAPAPAPAPPPAPYALPPPGYAQQPQPLPAPYLQPAPVLQPGPPPRSHDRTVGELTYLYGVGTAYGIGTGVWIDALGKVGDPGIAILAPLLIGAAAPIGVYLWDQAREFDPGVPSSMATGLLLGGIEGVAIDGLQWQLTGNGGPNTWDFRTWTTVTFAAATLGGAGGYAFGELFEPNPRSLALISSGAGWGAITGILFGAGVVGGDWKDGSAVWGFAGYNVGILAAGAVSTVYVPSFQTMKYMWAGQTLGILATTPIYLFYIGDSTNARHGLIANAVGGLAGLAVAALLTGNMSDAPGVASFDPPFQVAVGPVSSPLNGPASGSKPGGTELSVFGRF
jgi:hypothetical protein